MSKMIGPGEKDNSITLNDRPSRLFGMERVEPLFGGGRRDWSVDVLRCLSCFLVCAIHASDMSVGYGISDAGAGDNPWLHHEIYRMAVASPTVLFVMVSGIFFLSPERNVTAGKVWKKNVVKMVFAYIFWCLVYAVYRIHMMDPQPEVTWDFFLQQWMIQESHLWYIPMIIGLYILCPILRPITATYDKKLFLYIVILFMGGLILWTVYQWPTLPAEGSTAKAIIDKTPMALFCQYPFWMLYGWIAYTYRPKKGLRYLIYLIGIMAMVAGMLANIHNWYAVGDFDYGAVTQKFSIFQFLKNTALFYFIVTVFRDHEFSRIGKVLLRKWSDYTLIIYLIHRLFLLVMHHHNFLYSAGISPWIGVWIYAIIAYVGGGIAALVFHLFWDPLKRDYFTRKKRSERVYEKIEKTSR